MGDPMRRVLCFRHAADRPSDVFDRSAQRPDAVARTLAGGPGVHCRLAARDAVVVIAACLLAFSPTLMALRVVVLGQVPASLPEQLAHLPASLDVSVLGYHADSVSARAALSPVPDIALVSAALTDISGFAFVKSLAPSERPTAIVFTSGREEDAVDAFELQATDFVPMPVVAERLRDALARARQQVLQVALLRTADELQRLIGEANASGNTDLGALITRASGYGHANGDSLAVLLEQDVGSAAPRRKRDHGQSTGTLIPSTPWRAARGGEHSLARFTRDDAEEPVLDLTRDDGGRDSSGYADTRPLRVLVREGRRTRFVPLSDVDWFEADGNYILVHAAGEKYRTRGTITAIESALDPRQFVRIHRRVVVNMDRVREMSPLPGGDGLLMLGDGSTLRLSRTYRSRVR
jgi:two-component system LytT family response regulator